MVRRLSGVGFSGGSKLPIVLRLLLDGVFFRLRIYFLREVELFLILGLLFNGLFRSVVVTRRRLVLGLFA